MDTLKAIFGLVVLIGIGYGWYKIKAAIKKTANQKLFYRSENKEAKELLTPARFLTTLAISEIINSLSTYVDALRGKPSSLVKPTVYILYSGNDQIVYACGNKVYEKQFDAAVTFNNTESGIEVVFQVLHWTEGDGMLQRQNEMRTLRRQVYAAMTAIGGKEI